MRRTTPQPVSIMGSPYERADLEKQESICKNRSLYFLRKLKSSNVCNNLLKIF